MSLRLVQYDFETKEKLLLHGLQQLTTGRGARMADRVRATGDAPGPRELIEAVRFARPSAGLGSSVLLGPRAPEAATAVLRHHLDRLFTNSG
ncbi:hypothetical protein [Streptomyces caniferus]|uniref:hypothetical protein n=1 Tax=Streptomyces caniferus TaxID=285557 RepID=UPI0039A733A6